MYKICITLFNYISKSVSTVVIFANINNNINRYQTAREMHQILCYEHNNNYYGVTTINCYVCCARKY